MMEEDVAQEEEEEEEGSFPRLSGQSFTSGSEGGFLHPQRPGTQLSSGGTVLEEEEEEMEPCSQQGGTQANS